MPIPLPERSHAVIIGAGVRNDLYALSDTLRDPGIWGLPEDRCVIVPDPALAEDALVAAADTATDTLLVYYVGPLVAGERVIDRAAELLATSPARRRILILDCAGTGLNQVADRVAIDGCYVLVAVADQDFAPAGERFTAFTGELLYVLRNGLAEGGEYLDLDDIYAAVRQNLHEAGRPEPQKRARNAPGALRLVRNRAFVPATPDETSQARRAASRASEAFLRAHAMPRHAELYVSRQIDREVESAARALAPARLRERFRESTRAGRVVTVRRAPPPQIMVIRGRAGAGKTALAAQLATDNGAFLGIARSADQPEATTVAAGFELDVLHRVGMPLVYVVDGLDDADTPELRAGVLDLFALLGRLNATAAERGYLAFPLLLVFLVRDESWERSRTLFEGRRALVPRNHPNRFTGAEVVDAMKRYEAVFGYEINGTPDPAVLDAFAEPVLLAAFAESHADAGMIAAESIDPDRLIGDYLAGHDALPAARTPAWEALRDDSPWFADRSTIQQSLLVRHGAKPELARFRAQVVLEYLVALEGMDRLTELGRLTGRGTVVSASRVRDQLRRIARAGRLGPDVVAAIERYATSSVFLQGQLREMRLAIADGAATGPDDLAAIRDNQALLSATGAFEAFFVLAARRNGQSAGTLTRAFEIAWDANEDNRGRWKLLAKLMERQVLDDAGLVDVLRRLVDTGTPKEWEVFLGWALRIPDKAGLRAELDGLMPAEHPLVHRYGDHSGWRQARGLYRVLTTGEPYVVGTEF